MAIPVIFRRSYFKIKSNASPVNINTPLCRFGFFSRKYSDSNSTHGAEFINSTILMENGFNVQELPVIVRKIKDFTEVIERPLPEVVQSTPESHDYHLIKAEFEQCTDLKDVFSLLSKCTKITPNIALGAMERIYNLEKNPPAASSAGVATATLNINVAKGAILDKLLKVIMKTEDTHTILNILNSDSSFMEPYKSKFSDELLLRVIDNQLSIQQLCEFLKFLMKNKSDTKYSDTVDKLWVGFVDKEKEINETNIATVFNILPALKTSKKIILFLLEQKLADLWFNIQTTEMQDILNIFIHEKYLSMQSFAVVGRWFYANLHALDEDMMLDIVTKFTRLKYTDDVIEKAVEKYMKLKKAKIKSPILVVGILNYCMQFQIRNETVLEACSEYFIRNGNSVPNGFLISFIYPFGYLSYNPTNKFRNLAENIINEKFEVMSSGDICSIVLSYLYSGTYPLSLVRRLFSAEYLVRIHNPETLRKLHLIDTALALECKDYVGPLMPKDQWSKTISTDARVRNITEKIMDSLVSLAGSAKKISTAVVIPFLYADETYLIDIMLHPVGLATDSFNWKLKSAKNENMAVLIHLPDHFCADGEHLIGPQAMRQKHLKLLGIKVASVKYSILSKFYVSRKKEDLENYINECIRNAESC